MAKKALEAEKKINWILWSVIGVAVIGLIVGGAFIIKACLDKGKDDTDRITMFDNYDKLPYKYFLKDFVYDDPTETTTTEENTTTEEVIDVKDNYYLFVFDSTKTAEDYGCSSVWIDNVGYDAFLNEVKDVLDKAIANGIQVYVADVSEEKYASYEGATIDASYNYTGKFTDGKTDNDGLRAITVVGPALIKVEGVAAEAKYNVTVYYSGVMEIERDIKEKLKKFEGWTF